MKKQTGKDNSLKFVIVLLGLAILLQCPPVTGNLAEAANGGPGVTINVNNTDIRDVLSALALKMKVKIVYTEEPTVISFKSQGLSAMETLEVLLQNNGFTYIKDGGIFIVGSPEQLQESYFHKMMLTRFNLKYIPAGDLDSLVDGLGIPLQSITVDTNQRDIWVQGTPHALVKMKELVGAVDRPESAGITLEYRELTAGVLSPDRLAGILGEAGVPLQKYVIVGNKLLIFEETLFSRWDEVKELAAELDDYGSQEYSIFSYRLKYMVARDAETRLTEVLGSEDIKIINFNLPEYSHELMVACPPYLQSEVMGALMTLDSPKDRIRAPIDSADGDKARAALRSKRELLSELSGVSITRMHVSDNISGDADSPRYVLWVEETPDNIQKLRDLVAEF